MQCDCKVIRSVNSSSFYLGAILSNCTYAQTLIYFLSYYFILDTTQELLEDTAHILQYNIIEL